MVDVEENTVNDRDDQFLSFLKKTSLENFKDAFIKQGVEKIEHLQDIDEEDAKEFGLSKIQLKRLKREYALWNAEKTKSAPPSSNATCSTGTTSYKTSSSSVVLFLRPGFKDFFHTRDGQGNIVVSSKALKVKYQNLWYDNPLNPFQTFSNTFILQMAEYRMQFSKSLRECELWCRRMRQQRISLMIASAPKCALSKWTPYYRGRSVWGLHQQMCERYPQVQSCLEAEDGQEVPRNMYDSLCKFTEGIEKAHNLAKEARQQCDEQIALCGTPVKEGLLETWEFYSKLRPSILSIEGEIGTILERANQMVQIAREKFGSSASHVSLLRKRKKLNEKNKKRKKSKAGAEAKTVTEAEAMAEGGAEAEEVTEQGAEVEEVTEQGVEVEEVTEQGVEVEEVTEQGAEVEEAAEQGAET